MLTVIEIKENGFMGDMMILASGRQIFGIIMIILMVFIAFGLPILVTRLTNPKTVKEKIKRNKKCTVKTKARVTDMYGTMPVEFRGDSDAWSGGDRTIASYEYFVNGVRYTGRDEIFTSLGGVGKTIDVLYDPHDPSNSCTPWGKKADNGTEHIIPIFIVLGVIVVILLFILLAIRFLNSF